MPAFPQSNIHLDILMGRDECIEPTDVFAGAFFFFISLFLVFLFHLIHGLHST
jgi:hypothetical protein